MSDNAISNPAGVAGLTADFPYSGGPYLASAAVTAKTVVAVGTDGRVATAATNGTAALCIGVARDAIASGAVGIIIERGIVTGVGADGAITAGLLLKRSATTAGYVATTATPAIGEVIGFAIAASASSVVSMYVQPSKALS